MPPPQDEILMDLRLAVARLEVEVKSVHAKMDSAVVSRAHLEERLAPLTENMNRWKGGLAAITLVAGSVGALVTTFVKQWLVGPP